MFKNAIPRTQCDWNNKCICFNTYHYTSDPGFFHNIFAIDPESLRDKGILKHLIGFEFSNHKSCHGKYRRSGTSWWRIVRQRLRCLWQHQNFSECTVHSLLSFRELKWLMKSFKKQQTFFPGAIEEFCSTLWCKEFGHYTKLGLYYDNQFSYETPAMSV